MRRFALATVVTVGGFGVAAACGDPYDGEIPPPAEAGVDAAPEIDAALSDGGFEPDGPPPIDATSDKPAVDASCDPCDCDNDGYAHGDAATCADAGGRPLGDCDDLDPRAQPDAGFLDDLATADTRGDWNCDTRVTRERAVLIKCSNFGSLAVSCTNLEGFKGDPGCGVSADYVKCKNPPLLGSVCEEGVITSVKQRCK